MRVSQDEKTRSRGRILASAARRVRESGLSGAALSDVMRDAGMTHGGFYRHFASRDDLMAAAVTSAFDSFLQPLRDAIETDDAAAAVRLFRERYLSPDHVAHPEEGCPVPAVGSEMTRAPVTVRTAFADGLDRVIGLLAEGNPGEPGERRTKALRDFAMLAGAVVIARGAAPALAEELIAACAQPA